MENKVRLQHYVPRVYLKNFAITNKEKYYVFSFDKTNGKSFNSNIQNIAVGEEFYDRIDEEQVTEKSLSFLELEFGKIIEKLISLKDLEKLEDLEKRYLGLFIATQMTRTMEERLVVKDIVIQFLKKHEGQLGDEIKKQAEDILEEEKLRDFQKKMILEESYLFAEILIRMKWILIINKSNFPYWTSDNPVVNYNSLNLSPYGNLGLESPGIEVHIPLSSSLLLIICDPLSFSKEPSKKFSKDYRNITRERHLQLINSTRFIFSKDDKFNFADSMLRQHLELRDLNRKRFIIN